MGRQTENCMWMLDVKDSAGTEERKGVIVSDKEEIEIEATRERAHFICSFGEPRKATLNVIQIKGLTRAITSDDSGEWVPIVAFECRGMDVTGWYPGDGFRCVSEGGVDMGEVNLSEDYCDYDEDNDIMVQAINLEWRIEPQKMKIGRLK